MQCLETFNRSSFLIFLYNLIKIFNNPLSTIFCINFTFTSSNFFGNKKFRNFCLKFCYRNFHKNYLSHLFPSIFSSLSCIFCLKGFFVWYYLRFHYHHIVHTLNLQIWLNPLSMIPAQNPSLNCVFPSFFWVILFNSHALEMIHNKTQYSFINLLFDFFSTFSKIKVAIFPFVSNGIIQFLVFPYSIFLKPIFCFNRCKNHI